MQRRGHNLRKYGITEAWFRMIHRVLQEGVALLLEPMKSPMIDQRIEARRARIVEALNLKVLFGRPLLNWPILGIFPLMQVL
ncbi:MAG: hypothetical protein Udaeo2_30420 [Candidatus Udaeobacter sp.]|nr:MAG: hypothetical protein Udaeo2_30420 [Candidatus Udaeobacter sp.]